MRRVALRILTFILTIFLGPVCIAQTLPTPAIDNGMFSITANAVSLPGNKATVAGMLAGATFAITKNLSLRQTDIIAPGLSMNGYFGGFQYFVPNGFLKNTNIPTVQPYITASAGVDTVPGKIVGATVQHYSFSAGGGFNYKPTGSNVFVLGVELQWLRAPGAVNSGVLLSVGPKLSW